MKPAKASCIDLYKFINIVLISLFPVKGNFMKYNPLHSIYICHPTKDI